MGARWIVAGLVLAGVACLDVDGPPPGGRDLDRDGHAAAQDCDDRDPTVWRTQVAFRDADGDARGAGALDEVCSGNVLPYGWAHVAGDCDDTDRARWVALTGYADADGDLVGAGAAVALCTAGALPAGWAAVPGDCEPEDGARWRELPYLYRDADGDGVTIAAFGMACAGAMLPDGFLLDRAGVDCDDADADRWLSLYGLPDEDRDGVGDWAESWAEVCTGGELPPGYASVGGDCAPMDPTRWLSMNGFPDEDGDGAGAGIMTALCTAGVLPAGYVATSYDCAPSDPYAWARWSYAHRDADGDGRTVPESGEICGGATRPLGYLTVPSGSDCDDSSDSVWQALIGFADEDEDGTGAGEPISFCTGAALPAGHVALGGDCDPAAGEAWQPFSYSFRDGDGDGRTVPLSGTLCIGAAPPAGYHSTAVGNDCDDGDERVWATVVSYEDEDRDGFGAGAPASACTDGSLPAGRVAVATDCSPTDPTAWRLLAHAWADEDGDGHTVPDAGEVCAGAALPEPYRSAKAGLDCDDHDAAVFSAVVRYPDGDGDGVGAAPRAVFCVGGSEPPGHARSGWDVDDSDPAVQWDDGDEDLLLSL